MTEQIHLETERLILRPFQDSDLDAFLAYRTDPVVARYQGWPWPYTRNMALAFLVEMQAKTPGSPTGWYQWAIERRQTPGLVGDCAMNIRAAEPHQAEIGVTLAPAYQGQGYAFEAINRLLAYLFVELALHRVTATCDVENNASARLLERLGLRREAHFVQNFWFRDGWASEYQYAILRSEWNVRRFIAGAG
ncbi:MAG: hypothetical protein FOGNACKC_02487 [Anaerolineae bacterium]|nr:hypothetical protein [Anaerolineae bacterium]